MDILTILLLLTTLLLTRVAELKGAVRIIALQSFMLALACAAVGLETGEGQIFIAAVLTIVIKAGIMPYILMHVLKSRQQEREDNPIININYSALLACIAIVLAYGLTDQVLPGAGSRDALATAVAMTLIGLQLIITRRQATMQIIGMITMENGIYLVGLAVTKGFPLIIELGVFLDVFVAVMVLGILTYRLKLSGLSTDTSRLKKLKG